MNISQVLNKASWYGELLKSGDLKPYVFVRPDNRISQPGSRHKSDWFPGEPLYKNPLDLKELAFAELIYYIEGHAFGPANMAMPRWVFYDCAIIPGFVAGYAIRRSALQKPALAGMRAMIEKADAEIKATWSQKSIASYKEQDQEWVPLSLFIIIPTMAKGQWIAHNLCAINSLLDEKDRLYGLGFLSKAFGLWYANVEFCNGMTQWGGPALKLHSHYGHLEVMTAYTPVHSHAKTITYRVEVDTECWEKFFTKEVDYSFLEKYEPAGFVIDPKNEESMLDLHLKIQDGRGPFYISAHEIAQKSISEPLSIYKMKSKY